MELKFLLQDLDYELIKGTLNVNVDKICYDSRYVGKQSAFVAIKGYQVDGHKFISSAIQRGAKVIVLEDMPEEVEEEVTYIQTKNSRFALSKLACNYYNNPSKKLKVIGITGTNGKTSTSLMLKSILAFKGKKVGVIGTIGNFIGEKKEVTNHTTPESLELQGILSEMVHNGMEYVIMEASSHALQLDRVANIDFDHGIFTNLTQDHLDFHGDMQSYFYEKKKLFYMTKGMNVINTDDSYGKLLYEELKGNKKAVVSYGINEDQEMLAKDITYSMNGVEFTLQTSDVELIMNSPIPGKFSVYNLIAAISVALAEGISPEDIKRAIGDMPTVPGRIEKIDTDTPFHVIIDFAHTPDGLEKLLSTLREHVKGRLITLFGCGGDRDKGKRPIMGKIAGQWSDFCIVTTDNPRSEEPQLIIEDVLVGVKETSCEYVSMVDRHDAIGYAIGIAKEDDVIVLAGKGHETYQVLKDKTITFDEKLIVKEFLKNDCNKN